MSNVFEQPWTLLIVAVISLIALFIIGIILPDKKRRWHLLLPLLIGLAAFGVDFFVKTDLEKIKALISSAAKAVEQQDCSVIDTVISEDYRDSSHYNKKALMALCKSRMSQPLIEKAIMRILSAEISSPKATAAITVRIVFDQKSEVYRSFVRLMLIKVDLELQKEQNSQWFISRSEIVEINRQPCRWKDVKQANW